MGERVPQRLLRKTRTIISYLYFISKIGHLQGKFRRCVIIFQNYNVRWIRHFRWKYKIHICIDYENDLVGSFEMSKPNSSGILKFSYLQLWRERYAPSVNDNPVNIKSVFPTAENFSFLGLFWTSKVNGIFSKFGTLRQNLPMPYKNSLMNNCISDLDFGNTPTSSRRMLLCSKCFVVPSYKRSQSDWQSSYL